MLDYLLQYKEVITLLAGIGTFIYAIIALYTLIEVKKQRLSMYKPELFLKSFCVTPIFNPLSDRRKQDLLEYKVLNYNDYSVENNSNTVKPNISILYKLENMGFGVAKDVKCQWEYDYKKAIKIIEGFMPSDYEFYQLLSFYGLRKKSDEDFHDSASIIDKKDFQAIDYVSPINQSQHGHKHTVPSIIFFTYMYYLIFKNNLTTASYENFHGAEFDGMPKPKLQITYKDINGKKYKKTYIISISCCSSVIKDIVSLEDELCIFYCICEEYK